MESDHRKALQTMVQPFSERPQVRPDVLVGKTYLEAIRGFPLSFFVRISGVDGQDHLWRNSPAGYSKCSVKMGVLKGIYKYEQESKSEFKNWAADVADECFGYILEEWKKRMNNKDDLKDMSNFLKKECSEWAD